MKLLVTGAGGMLGRDAALAAATPAGHRRSRSGHERSSTSPTRRRSRTRSPTCARTRSSTAPPGPTSTAPRRTSAPRCGSTTPRPASSPPPPRRSARSRSTSRATTSSTARKGRPYVESDMPAAISAYGRSKQAGETSVATANPRHFIVRSSWLFGAAGRTSSRRCCASPPSSPRSSSSPTRSPARPTRRHLAQALALLIETDDYGIHHIAAGGRCSWFEFAQEIFDQAALDTRVMAGTTEMLGRPAPRPALSLLAASAPTRSRCPTGARAWRLPRRARARRGAHEASSSPGAPGSSAPRTCATAWRPTRTSRCGCSTSSPTPAGARTSQDLDERLELVVADIVDARGGEARRSTAATRSSTSPPRPTSTARSTAPGRVHPDRRLRDLRPARGRPRGGHQATCRSRPTRSTARSRRARSPRARRSIPPRRTRPRRPAAT